jgi:hypothetical protein
MFKAGIIMQDCSIWITVRQQRVTVFKSYRGYCDFNSFDSRNSEDIVEYVIAPMSRDRWEFNEHD